MALVRWARTEFRDRWGAKGSCAIIRRRHSHGRCQVRRDAIHARLPPNPRSMSITPTTPTPRTTRTASTPNFRRQNPPGRRRRRRRPNRPRLVTLRVLPRLFLDGFLFLFVFREDGDEVVRDGFVELYRVVSSKSPTQTQTQITRRRKRKHTLKL